MEKVVITKMGGEKPKKHVTKHSPSHKTQKVVKSILKIRGVSDPARAPPMKREMKKHTLRMLTEKGMRKHRKTLKHKISKMKDNELDKVLEKSNMKLSSSTPRAIKDKILENAVSAGFLSL
jgi:hypothetical protein